MLGIKIENPKKEKIIRIAKLTGKITALTIFIFLFVNAFLTLVIPSYRLSVFGSRLYSVVSDSMEPHIKTGSLIAAKRLSQDTQIAEGDVIVYKVVTSTGSVVIAHRVVEVIISDTEQSYITKGDNAQGFDSYIVKQSDVLGIYTGKSVRLLGFIFSFISSPYGFFCLTIILVLLVIAIVVNNFIEKFDRSYAAKKNILGKTNNLISQIRRKYGDQPEIVFLDYALGLLNEQPEKNARDEHRQDLEALAQQKTLELPPKREKIHVMKRSEITIIKPNKK